MALLAFFLQLCVWSIPHGLGYPGPFLFRANRLRYIFSLVTGNLVKDVQKIHQDYGDLVRIAPDELSFAKEDAWADVYAPRANVAPLSKNPIFFKAPPGQAENVFTVRDLAENQRMRKVFAPSFTGRAVVNQEPIVQAYSDLLVKKLHELATAPERKGNGADVNLTDWFMFYTFDVIGDLALGESFKCMENSSYHRWVSLTFSFLKGMAFAGPARYYPLLETLLMQMIPPKIWKLQQEYFATALDRLHRRLNLEKQRPDFISTLLKSNPDFNVMSLAELESTISLLIIAGSETTATVLAGTVNYLIQSPESLGKLQTEVRSRFKPSEDMSFKELQELPFLDAVINEGLRLCNPVPGGTPRVAPKHGATICGLYIPGGTHINVHPTAMSRSEKNFHRADEFLPFRFLPEEDRPVEFANDRHSTQHPFSLGPRVCMGRPLAWAQMRLVLAHLMLQFDIGPSPDHLLDWTTLKTFVVLEKRAVVARLKARNV